MKTIGIIGGMGPSATYDLANKIIANTQANCDQEHIHVCIDCNTAIPDRTDAILNGRRDPLPELVKSALRLENMGAQLLIMPCNTAHYFYDQIGSFLDVPMLHMPGETARVLKEKGLSCAGVLATDGTKAVGIYDEALKKQWINAVYPSEENQKQVMRIIYERVKAGNLDLSGIPVQEILQDLWDQGAQAVILGCTELPIAFQQFQCNDWHLIDPTNVLARAAISFAGGMLVNKR